LSQKHKIAAAQLIAEKVFQNVQDLIFYLKFFPGGFIDDNPTQAY